jgi:predicted RNA-binding protein with RPS1 domain
VGHRSANTNVVVASRQHAPGCTCPPCAGVTALFAEGDAEATADVPAEVEAMDGILNEDEAHNSERPARSNLQKKTKREPRGTAVSDLEVGSMVTGKVRSITSYGAFIDIGAQTDGLLHISQLASGFVKDVGEVLKDGQQVEVRIVSVDVGKNQVALSLMTESEAAAGQSQQGSRPPRQQSNRRDDNAAMNALAEKGWDSSAFVEGTVVSTVDFGCFVRIDTSLLNPECTGELDGLVHISALSTQRVSKVSDAVSVNEKVKIRVKSIDGTKVSLTMLSVAEEESKSEARSSGGGGGGSDGAPPSEGAKDWQELIGKIQVDSPKFNNRPIVTSRR